MEDLQLDILNSCRICLQQDVELQSIFSVSISEVDLPKIVMSLAPILILEKDGLSEKVCEECQDEIFKAFKLQQLCIQSDKNQRDLLKLPAVEDVEMPDIFNIYKNEDVSEDVSGGSEFNDVFIFDNVETKYENDGIHFLDNISEPEEKKSFKCNQCDKVFLKQTSLLRHLNSNAHKLKNVQTLNNHSKLKEIDTQKQQAVRLKESTQSSQDVDTYQEEDADQIEFNAGLSTKKKKLRKHKCQLCDKLFEKPSKLVRHLNSSVHNIALKPFECLECHQRFATEQLLTRHGVLHSSLITPTVPVERHVCIVCSKEFPCHEAKASHLKSHKLELEQMEFQCVLCPKIFKKINDLTRHSKTHMENRQHKCNVCNKLFARGSYLIDHLNQHKGLRPHKCNICQKSFQHSYTLKNHMM